MNKQNLAFWVFQARIPCPVVNPYGVNHSKVAVIIRFGWNLTFWYSSQNSQRKEKEKRESLKKYFAYKNRALSCFDVLFNFMEKVIVLNSCALFVNEVFNNSKKLVG